MRRSLLFILACIAITAQAQTESIKTKASEKPVFSAPLKNNWFIGGGVGVSSLFGDYDMDAPDGRLSNLTPNLSVQVGKWVTPHLGFRWKVGGATLKGYNPASVMPGSIDGITKTITYLDSHLDLMYSITGDQTLRPWNFSLFAGMGGVAVNRKSYSAFTIPRHFYMLYKAGAIASYNLKPGLSVFGELEGSFVPDLFDGVVAGDWFHDFYLTPSVGLTYRFKGTYRGFETGLSAGEINDMNDKINNLNASNQELSKQKVSLEKDNISLKKDLATAQVKVAEKTTEAAAAAVSAAGWINGSKIILGGVVKFDTDKSVCQAGEEAKIAEAAAELKKQKDVVIELGGYASKEGNNWYNMMLSNKRAKFVAGLLKSKYDVPASQIEIIPYGISKNPMTDDGKNKVVVFFLKKK